MAVVAADLLSPRGPVDPSLFPGEGSNVLETRLTGYIANGEADIRITNAPGDRQDGLITNWALYQVFRDAHLKMVTQPLSVTIIEKGGHAFSVAQIQTLEKLRDKYLADFLAELPSDSVKASAPVSPGSLSVSTDVRWN